VLGDRGEAARAGRTLALDVGDRVIGVALSDPLGLTGQALCEIRRTSPERDVEAVVHLARTHGAACVVVGLPRSLNGSIGPQAEKVLAFVARLRAALPVPVALWDERLSTAQAERALIAADVRRARRRRVIDRVAAAIILQSYLDARVRGGVQHRTDPDEHRGTPAGSERPTGEASSAGRRRLPGEVTPDGT
jgi:putative Holliday junction resolvase